LKRHLAHFLPRAIFCVFMAGFAAAATMSLEGSSSFTLEVALASSTDGVLQVFYDRGAGISEADSTNAPIRSSSQPVTYRLPLPAGRYRLFRIDPNDRGGEYSFTSIRVLTARDVSVASIPVGELTAAAQATVSFTGTAAVVRVAQGANDPQLLYPFRPQLSLVPDDGRRRRALTAGSVAALASLLFLLLVERFVRFPSVPGLTERVHRFPAASVAAAGLAATIVATYPLFLGRSLVSPNNGATAFLYGEPPFVYESGDYTAEDTRGTDVGSMMWAILPYVVSQREAVAHGEFPLWNRYNAIGRPLWGQAQHFFLEPVHFLALAIGEPSYIGDVTFIAGRAIFSVGIGMAALAATSSLPAAASVAIAAPFIGHFAFRFNHPAYFSVVYVPWILWAYFRLASRSSPRALAKSAATLIVASVLQLVGSTPKEGVIAFAIAHLTGVLALILARGSISERLQRLSAAGVAAALTLLVSAPHWLIFLDTLRRSYTAYDTPSVSLGGLHEIAAIVLGPLKPGMPYPSLNGVVAVAAATGLLSAMTLWQQRAALAAAAGGAVALAVACGAIPATVIVSLPLLGNIYHVWNVFITAALAPLLIVAAAGVAALRATRFRPLAALAAGVVVMLVVMKVGAPGLPGHLIVFSVAPGVAFALLLAIPRPGSRAAFVAATLVVLGMGLLPGGLQVETGARGLDAVLFQPRERVDLDAAPPAVTVARSRAGNEPFRVASLSNTLFAGVQAFYRLEGITGPDALELRELRELSDAAGIDRNVWRWRPVYLSQDLIRAKGLLDMLGVRFVFGTAYEFPRNAVRIPLPEPDAVQVIERPTAWPRAFWVDGVRRHSSVGALISELNSSPGAFASIDAADRHAVAFARNLPSKETNVVRAREYRLTPNRTSFVVDAPGPGVVVLAEAYVPRDFVATRNGMRVEYFRTNHAFKAVTVTEGGSWTIELEYRPEKWMLSWLLCAVGVTLTAGLLVLSARSSRGAESGI
jgi:hypothetical protein